MTDSKPTRLHALTANSYDAIATILTLFTTTMDIIITIRWYHQNLITFFWISVSILILIHIMYIVMFFYATCGETNVLFSVLNLICLIPFAPILFIIWLFIIEKDHCSTKFINKLPCYNFYFSKANSQWGPTYGDWLEDRLDKAGMQLWQAILESFPELILQLVAIFFFHHTNDVILCFSILISILNILFKFVLPFEKINGNIHRRNKLVINVWLCFSMDFILTLFIITLWLNELCSDIIGVIYFWQSMICVLPFISIGWFLCYWFLALRKSEKNGFLVVIVVLIIFPMISIVCIPLFPIATITNVSWTLLPLIGFGVFIRWPIAYSSGEFYENVIKWVMTDSIDRDQAMAKRQDRLIKLCIVNDVLMNSKYIRHDQMMKDGKLTGLIEYLQMQKKTYFRKCCYNDLKIKANYKRKNRVQEVLYGIKDQYKQSENISKKCWNGLGLILAVLLAYIIVPIYSISRIFNVLFPFGIIIYFYSAEGINFFVDMDLLQIMLWTVYVFVSCLWLISSIFAIEEEYYSSFILPSYQDTLPSCEWNKQKEIYRHIHDTYSKMISYPVIEQYLKEIFGIDLAHAILVYFDSIQLVEEDVAV